MGAKIQKSGAKIQKSQKKFRHYVAKTFFFDEGPFYPVLVRSSPEGGGGRGRGRLAVPSVRARGGGGDAQGTAGYTYVSN